MEQIAIFFFGAAVGCLLGWLVADRSFAERRDG